MAQEKIINSILDILNISFLSLIKKFLFFISGIKGKALIASLEKKGKPINLEFGECKKRLSGGVTVDVARGADIRLDFRNPLPFQSNCTDQIYTSHLLEHLPYDALIKLLKECFRILKREGSLTVAVPNARIYLEAYIRPQNFNATEYCAYKPGFKYHSEIDYVNYIAYMDGHHHYMFDEKQLISILQSIGFKNVHMREFAPSIDLEERKMGSIYAIAKKEHPGNS
jgi:predicted SAM-dependent methyltransferase